VYNQASLGALLQEQTECLERLFDHIPILVNITGPDGFVRYVNRCWEQTLGWTRKEIIEQNLDIFAACYPDAQKRQEVLDFVAAAGEEWREFRHLAKDRQEMETCWIEMRLAVGMVLGLGVDNSHKRLAQEALQDNRAALAGPLFNLARGRAYLSCLFAPPCPSVLDVVLRKIEPVGHDLRLHLTWTADNRAGIIDIPANVADLCARHGSADLLVRMIRNRTGFRESAAESES
jgi:PAS domain S-box-containing protein